MIILITPRGPLRDDVSCVPVQKGLSHEVLIVVSKEVSDMPVPVVIPLYLLVQTIVFLKDECLGAQLIQRLLLFRLLLSICLLVVRAFFSRLSLISHDQGLIS